MPTVEEVLNWHGGRMRPDTLGPVQRQHVDHLHWLFRPVPKVIPSASGNLDLTPPPRHAQFHVANNWKTNASAVLADEVPVVIFHAGTAFALFHLYSALWASRQYFTGLYDQGEGESISVPMEHLRDCSYIKAATWNDWMPLSEAEVRQLRASAPDNLKIADDVRKAVTLDEYIHPTPLSIQRRQLRTNGYIDTVLFIFLHEIAHIQLGHLEFGRRMYGMRGFAEFYNGPELSDLGTQQHATTRSMEFDADADAITRIIHGTIRTYDSPQAILAGRIDGEKLPLDLLLALTISNISCFFLMQWVVAKAAGVSFITHPTPMSRLLSLQLRSIAVVKVMLGKDVGESVRNVVIHEVGTAASLLGLGDAYLTNPAVLERCRVELSEHLSCSEGLKSQLAECQRAVAERYYLEGKQVTNEEYYESGKTQAEDPFLLRNQRVVHVHEDGSREIVKNFDFEERGPSDANNRGEVD